MSPDNHNYGMVFKTAGSSFRTYVEHTLRSLSGLRYSPDIFRAADLLSSCRCHIVVSGMGKAGIIGRKMAATLSSLAMPASFMHPGDALHGDLGMAAGSTLILLSTSGRTREVREVLRQAEFVGVGHVIVITANAKTPLRKRASAVVNIGKHAEAGRIALVPTTTALAMLAMTDFICLLAAELRGTTISEFASRHHSGYLGYRARKEQRK